MSENGNEGEVERESWSWFAVAGFALAVCPFVLFLMLVALRDLLGDILWGMRLFCWPTSVVVGFMALSEIKKRPLLKGKGLAKTGIGISAVCIVLLLLGFWLGHFKSVAPRRKCGDAVVR